MNKKRPVNLDLASLKYPPMAIVSILHRLSGVVLFLLLPIMLFILAQSLNSAETFRHVKNCITYSLCYKVVVWAFGSALICHLFAGMRHLLMDMGWGEHLKAGRCSALFVLVCALVLTFFLGVYLW